MNQGRLYIVRLRYFDLWGYTGGGHIAQTRGFSEKHFGCCTFSKESRNKSPYKELLESGKKNDVAPS